jgi:hypothetical protein
VTGHRPEALASKLRVLTAGRVPIDTWSELSPARAAWPDAMILSAGDAAKLDLAGYRARAVSTEVQHIPIAGLAQAIRAGRIAEFLDAQRAHYVLAIRR